MQAMRRLVRVLVVLGVAAATASAQQGPTAAPATPTPTTPATPAAPATPTPATPAAPAPVAGTTNITSILAKGGQFNTFIRLLKSTGMASQIDNQLQNNGNGLTVFAPTDNAFTSLPSGTLNSLSDQEKNALVQYHVVSTAIPKSQFDTVSNPLRTQAGSASPGEYPLNITSDGSQQANISTGVVNATVDNDLYSGDNLVVYQVNKVLLPAKLFGPAVAPAPAPLAPAKKKGKTPASVADSPEAAEASPDATASLAAARVTRGGLAAALLALAGVWWGL
ncbi:hypothetical protein SEVIR_5G109600v4 [Setaria viridis]|uniref:FAS1 domain-containing protein n=1 Tax=Setaria viridis TaxID=4556 RepID=A0A4U6URF8_SETVI|nr:fasciclin-like arabinogalactan protein 11 [Setaria viridis]TKW13557.1 hypothetical protein SEVIR_5G109600v2 [Setaria viridis]